MSYILVALINIPARPIDPAKAHVPPAPLPADELLHGRAIASPERVSTLPDLSYVPLAGLLSSSDFSLFGRRSPRPSRWDNETPRTARRARARAGRAGRSGGESHRAAGAARASARHASSSTRSSTSSSVKTVGCGFFSGLASSRQRSRYSAASSGSRKCVGTVPCSGGIAGCAGFRQRKLC